MYYYGYQGSYGYNSPCYGGGYSNYPFYGQNNQTGYGAAIILVLFILLVIVIGARWINND